MRKPFFQVCLVLLFAITRTNAQDILRISEKDQDNKTFENPRNVDINSALTLHLDRDSLLKRINAFDSAGTLPANVKALLKDLQTALQKRGEWIDSLQQAVIDYKKGGRKKFEAFNQTRRKVAVEILALLQDQKLKAYFEEDESRDIWLQLTNAITRRIRDLQQELLASPAYADYRIQVGGWLIRNGQTTPLHLEGFDTNPVGEFYEVERWRFLPTPSQLADLQNMETLARMNEQKDMGLAEILRSNYVQLFTKSLEEKVNKGISDLKTEADKVLASLGIAAVKTDVENVLNAAEALKILLVQKISFYTSLKQNPSFSLSMLLGTLPNDITQLNQGQENVRKELKKLEDDINAARDLVNRKAPLLPQIVATMLTDFATAILGSELIGIAGGTSTIADAALAFSDQVLPLSLKDLPEQAITDLRSTGFREAGDRVLVRLVILKGESKKKIYQENNDVRLYRILPHSETTVGVVFAHPLAPTSIQKQFQMAPYFNLLFKEILGASQKWKRRSGLPNTLLDFSLGLHVSSPDFDKDDVPELGVGVVGSTLKDYLQFGWAYNVFHGTPYVFFGIRLPVPSLGSNNTSATTPSEPGNNQ